MAIFITLPCLKKLLNLKTLKFAKKSWKLYFVTRRVCSVATELSVLADVLSIFPLPFIETN